MLRIAPLLYRGFSPAGTMKYTGFNWDAFTYLTDNLELASIYGRFGETKRAVVPSSLIVTLADDPVVQDIQAAANPSQRAKELGVQAVWNPTGRWVGKVHGHEFIVFDKVAIRFSPLTKAEQAKAEHVKEMLKSAHRVASDWQRQR